MNSSPYVDPHKPSQEIWEEFSMSFTPAVREVVEFAKRIPGFRDLPEHDQVSLLKAGTFEVSVTTCVCYFLLSLKWITGRPTVVFHNRADSSVLLSNPSSEDLLYFLHLFGCRNCFFA